MTTESVKPTVNAGKLWAGGGATAAVAALIAVAGILLGRGIFDIDVLAPKGQGTWGTPAPAGTRSAPPSPPCSPPAWCTC